ncbi:MAG: GDP-L-fucose synthase [Pseudomonadota bacterium]
MMSDIGAAKTFVAGHRGMVGRAIMRTLQNRGYDNLLTADREGVDLTNQSAVNAFFERERPEVVYLAAARVGGIQANNTYPADFIYQNVMIASNVVQAAYATGVKRLLFLGSSCIYPKYADQPMHEDALLTGVLEPTNEPYAVAKIAGLKLCESYNRQFGTDFRAVMPTNLYGPFDNFDLETSHVLPALLRKFDDAKRTRADSVPVWGTGASMREFLHVDDMADASVHVMELDPDAYARETEPMVSHINVGTGEDVTIRQLAELIRDVVGFDGAIAFDASKPEGAPRKLLDVSKLKRLGWSPRFSLRAGIENTYTWYSSQPQAA